MSSSKESISKDIIVEYFDREIKCKYCHKIVGMISVDLEGGDCYDCSIGDVEGLHEDCFTILLREAQNSKQ